MTESALGAALTAPYKRRERRLFSRVPILVLLAAMLVGLQSLLFALSALVHLFSESDAGTAATLALGVAGAALVAVGLIRGVRVAYVMAVAYALVSVVLSGAFDHRPAVASIVLLLLLGTSSRYFFHR